MSKYRLYRAMYDLEGKHCGNEYMGEVITCKDCRFWKNEHLCLVMSRYGSIDTKAEHYCSWGEREKRMINLKITDNREDIRKWTGLPSDNYDEALWNAGFNLDDWDICIESDTRLIREVEEDGEIWTESIDEAWWLVSQMEAYCVGFNEVEYNGKWYYTVHHA